MKKLLFVLLIVALASYLFVGCLPVTPDDGGEGEGEGESEAVVAIDGAVVIDGKTYVSGETHTVTVTFPAPVVGWVDGEVSMCEGDYSKDSDFVLFPDATKKVWTGSADFYYDEQDDCCAAYVGIAAGECEMDACIWFPVIVDSCPPYAAIEVTVDECTCDGCAITFATTSTNPECAEGEVCCGDDCSGLASWSINLYDDDPYDECCDPTVCEEPIATDSGVCPVDFTTACLLANTTANPYYYVVVNLVDNVGLEQNYYATIVVSGGEDGSDCSIVVNECFETEDWVYGDACVWCETETSDIIGLCYSVCDID